MHRAAISSALIFGQVAMACATPLCICTSATGIQRIEWGACECQAAGNATAHGQEDCDHEQLADATDREIAPPCRCDHQPLADASRLTGRVPRDSWDEHAMTPPGSAAWFAVLTPSGPQQFTIAAPCGHTPLVDHRSICLRC